MHHIDYLNKNTIIKYLSATQFIELEILQSIDSTNNYLLSKIKDKQPLPPGSVVLAEQQTKGKGRYGRSWVSPYADNIYLSYYWQSRQTRADLANLSLVIGVAVISALAKLGSANYLMKWPNDIVVQNKKLAGILIETMQITKGLVELVIGIGVNVKNIATVSDIITQPVIDLETVLGHVVSRNQLAGYIISAIKSCLANAP